MTNPTPLPDRRQRISIVVAAVVGLALVAAMITRTSEAAFTASTANAGNSFNAGTVELQDNDSGGAMFAVDAMEPGESRFSCIVVDYVGTIADPSQVRVYSGAAPTDPSGLGDWISITVERGTSSSTGLGNCTGFTAQATPYSGTTLTAFSGITSYGAASGTWDPVGTPESRTYRITATLSADTPNGLQDATISGVEFVWEIQN